jgi:hypothetical protein
MTVLLLEVGSQPHIKAFPFFQMIAHDFSP